MKRTNTDGAGLTPKMEQAAIMLAGGATVTDAAAAVEVDRATVSGWQSLAAFEARVNQVRQAAIRAAEAKTLTLGAKALDRMERLIDSQNERIALSAAMAILERMATVRPGETSASALALIKSLQDSFTEL